MDNGRADGVSGSTDSLDSNAPSSPAEDGRLSAKDCPSAAARLEQRRYVYRIELTQRGPPRRLNLLSMTAINLYIIIVVYFITSRYIRVSESLGVLRRKDTLAGSE